MAARARLQDCVARSEQSEARFPNLAYVEPGHDIVRIAPSFHATFPCALVGARPENAHGRDGACGIGCVIRRYD